MPSSEAILITQTWLQVRCHFQRPGFRPGAISDHRNVDQRSPTQPYQPDARVLTLGDGYWDVVSPATFPERHLRFRNDRAAETVGLADLSPRAWEDHFARFVPLPENLTQQLALRYHGHQFGVYNPQLGDGR